ncbi:MAG: hypothetical protein EHM34_03360 [Nitrosopumilales archaeon]|nr:MAG: hypothetical protein EHM34_03360 [Nitrosopumilales archaeon]
MTISELHSNIKALRHEVNLKIHMLRQEYVQEHAKFKVGDFIGNVTGIIKVERIGYECYGKDDELLDIKYFGTRYRKSHGEYIQVKNRKNNPPFNEEFCKYM